MTLRSLKVMTWLGATLLILGCTRWQSTLSGDGYSSTLFSQGETSLVPSTDKLSQDCAINANFDTCLFLKNPVAQEQAAVDLTQLDATRRFGVKIRGLSPTGRLENRDIHIRTLHTPQFSLLEPSTFKAPYAETTSFAEQLSAYYWLERAANYLRARLGSDLVPTLELAVFVDDAFTGYVSTSSSLHLEKKSGAWSKALNADVVIHLWAEALAQRLSAGRLFPASQLQHNFCQQNSRGCCKTADGCSQALASAFGDYMVAVLFPGAPRLGETISANVGGQSLCGLNRDLGLLSSVTKQNIFNACTSANGLVTLMGAWYASKWWTLRQQVEASTPGAALEMDRLFTQQAQNWTATTTFSEAKSLAQAALASYRQGLYLAQFNSIFSDL